MCPAGRIAQLVEQRTENPCVPGSIPGPATTFHQYHPAPKERAELKQLRLRLDSLDARSLAEDLEVKAEEKIDEEDKLSCATRWVLEEALLDIETLSHRTNNNISYEDAEDVEDSDFTERRIGGALKNWQDKMQGGYKDSYGYGEDEK